MNTAMFRAKTKDGQLAYKDILDKYWYYYIGDGKYFIMNGEICPSTISMKTFQKDKNGENIYGSFELEGYGMTEGGDMIKSDAFDFDEKYLYKTMIYNVVLSGGTWILNAQEKTVANGMLHSIGSGLLEIIKQENKESAR